MARENTGWGYDRIVGALTNLGHRLSDQTVGNILRGHRIAPAPKRSQTTLCVVLPSFGKPPVRVAGITRHPDQEWMEQIARSATQETWGYLHPCRTVLHERDTKFCASFRTVLAAA